MRQLSILFALTVILGCLTGCVVKEDDHDYYHHHYHHDHVDEVIVR